MKKLITLLAVSIGVTCFSCLGTAFALGSNPPAVTSSQLDGSRPDGGTVKLDYELNTNLGAKPMSWDDAFTYFDYQDSGCYKLRKISGNNSYFFNRASKVFDVLPNRNYLVSALVYCDFDRANSEVNIGMRVTDSTEASVKLIDGFHGLPADTNGQWLRFETTVTTPPDAEKARFYGAWYGFYDTDEVFCIADMEVIELPAETLTPLAVGEGLTFGGSSGMYDMKVSTPAVSANSITVQTNGAEYVFDKTASTITVKQRIGNPRTLAVLQLNKSLANLAVHGTPTDKEAILTTGEGGLSFGIQMDGMMLISTHDTDAEVTLTSEIGGEWNRLLSGNLISMDDTGGFTVNPAIPLGTGRLARCEALSGVDFERERGDTSYLSTAEPGWSVKWTISSGERLGVTAFPPREYDWENSFDSAVANINFDRETSTWQSYKNSFNLKYGVLWSAFQGAYAMSYDTQMVPKDEDKFKAHIAAANTAGVEPLEYISMFFWDGTLDEYINEVKRHRDTYGITGVYTDGVPPLDWLKAYDGMRRLRELFPEGGIIVHTTGQTANGGAPLATPEVYIPAIDAYATLTLRGESVPGTTKDWAYPRYVTSGYGASNAFGLQKYDTWELNGEKIPDAEQQLIHLLYNGRARYDGYYSSGYINILAKAKSQWLANSWSDTYYEDCYLPYVRRLVREEHAGLVSAGTADEYPVTNVLSETFGADSKWQIGTGVIEGEALKLAGSQSSQGEFLPSYGQTEISFKVKFSASSQGRIDITDAKGETAISLLQTGDTLRYLNRRGGYAVLSKVSADSYIDVVISADPATGKYSLSVDGTELLSDEPFRLRTAELSRISIENNAPSAALYIDDIIVNSGL